MDTARVGCAHGSQAYTSARNITISAIHLLYPRADCLISARTVFIFLSAAHHLKRISLDNHHLLTITTGSDVRGRADGHLQLVANRAKGDSMEARRWEKKAGDSTGQHDEEEIRDSAEYTTRRLLGGERLSPWFSQG